MKEWTQPRYEMEEDSTVATSVPSNEVACDRHSCCSSPIKT